jgi:hypothetical protein
MEQIGVHKLAEFSHARACVATPQRVAPPVALPVEVDCQHDSFFLVDANNVTVALFGATQDDRIRAEHVALLLNSNRSK